MNGVCSLKWCDETAGHDGPHRAYLMSAHGLDVDTGKPALIGLVLQGETSRVYGLVVTTDAKQTGLPWGLARRLDNTLSIAIGRFAP